MKLYPRSRPANVTPLVARRELAQHYPKARIASFDVSPDGTKYIAKLAFERVADIPPQFRGAEDDDEGASDAPPEADDGPDSAPVDEEDADEKPKEKKEDKKKGDTGELLDLVKEIAKAVGVPPGAGEKGPEDDIVPPDAMDVPPPPGAGGLPGPPPVADKMPLPPPAKPGGGGGLGTPFAHVTELRQKVAGKRVFTAFRTDILDDNGNELSTRKIADDARALFPDAELIKLDFKNAKVNGGPPQRIALLGFKRKA